MYSLCEEFPFQGPGLAINIQYLTEPMERIGSDFSKGPFGWCSIRATPDLNYIFAAPASNLVFPVVMNRVPPHDSPSLDRGIPDPQCRTKHVVRSVCERVSTRTARHNPDVLDSPPFQNPPEVCFALYRYEFA